MEEKLSNRYPGSRPFENTEIDRKLFKGREDEKQRLFHFILAEKLVVLFSKSGVGKSSLINAGLFKLLSDRDYFPVRLRLNDPEMDPVELILKEINQHAEEASIDYNPVEKTTLWENLKNAEFWAKDDVLLTPVLIFDQFEEIFTLYSEEQRKAFIQQLADLVRGSMPKSLKDVLSKEEKARYGDTAPEVKILLSMREDFLAQLEEMATEIPNILRNRFRLTALTTEKAKRAIEEPALIKDKQLSTRRFMYEPKAIEAILTFLHTRREGKKIIEANEIEPFQLQLICQHIEDKILQKQKTGDTYGEIKVTEKDLGGHKGMQEILRAFYDKQIKRVKPQKRKTVRKLCEKRLISPTGRRLSLDEEIIINNYKVPKNILSNLIDYRLLRAEPRLGSFYYEICHDTLVSPILHSMKIHRTKRRMFAGATVVLAFLFFGSYVVQWLLLKDINEAEELRLRGDGFRNAAENYLEESPAAKEQDSQEWLKYRNLYSNAIESYQGSLELNENVPNTHKVLALSFIKIEELETAVQVYRDAIRIDPNYASIYRKLVKELSKKPDRRRIIDTALEIYNIAVNADLEDLSYFYNLGVELENRALGDSIFYALADLSFKKATQHVPKDQSELRDFLLSYIGWDDNTYYKVIQIYRDSVQANPDYASIYIDLTSKMESESSEQSEIYDIALNAALKDLSYFYRLGNTLDWQGQPEKAKESFKKATQLKPIKDEDFKSLVRSHINLNEYDRAIEAYREAVKSKPEHASIYLDLIKTFWRIGKDDKTNEIYDIALNADSKDLSYFYHLGIILDRQDQYEKAKESFTKATNLKPIRDEDFKSLVRSHIKLSEYDGAIEAYQDAVKTNPGYASIYNDLITEFRRNEKSDEAERVYGIALNVDLEDASYFKRLARSLKRGKKYDLAVKSYKKAIEFDPTSYDARMGLALTYLAQGDYAAAVTAARIKPYDSEILNDIAWQLAGQGENLEDALELSIDCIKLVPENPHYWDTLAEIYFQLERLDEAQEANEKAQTFFPPPPTLVLIEERSSKIESIKLRKLSSK